MEQLDNLVWIIYIVDQLLPTDYNDGFGILLVLSLIGLASIIFSPEITREDKYLGDEDLWWKYKRPVLLKTTKNCVIIGVIYFLYYTITPHKDTAYKMLAVYGGVEVIQNPEVQKLGGKGVEVLNKIMDDFLKEEEEH